MAIIVFACAAVLFAIAVALVAYRLPAFGERKIFKGDTQLRKFDTSSRSLFETAFGRGMVALDDHTELYLPTEGNSWIGWNTPVYHVTASASPLMFGGYADAKLIKVTRVNRRELPAHGE